MHFRGDFVPTDWSIVKLASNGTLLARWPRAQFLSSTPEHPFVANMDIDPSGCRLIVSSLVSWSTYVRDLTDKSQNIFRFMVMKKNV